MTKITCKRYTYFIDFVMCGEQNPEKRAEGFDKMVLRSMHEWMHAARFCSAFFFIRQLKLLPGLLCYEDDSFTILLRFNRGSAVYCQICHVEIQ